MTCYSPSRHYLSFGLVAVGFTLLSGWWALQWTPASVAAVLFLASAAILLTLALQPSIEIYEHHLAIGKRVIPWSEIERLDRTSWISPLVVNLTLTGARHKLLIYPGDIDAGKSLLRHLCRCAKDGLIDGIPYRQFWGEVLPPGVDRRQLTSPRYQLLRADDEAEVERLFQRLKAVGHLDPKGSDEK
ncbi:MAG TPA: hypothetical protein VM120_19885 [Bryobacteraceae bacterium]|nr:hypothetical protein [Bryobacteraceae bacterium]